MPFSAYLATAPSNEFAGWTVAAALLAAAAAVFALVFLRRTRIMEDMATSRIRSAAQGYVEFEGRVRLMDGPPIAAPLSAVACVWWRFKIEQKETYYQNGRRHTRWSTISSGTSDDCFLLDDGTGTCVVDPVGASVIPTTKQTWYGATARPSIGPAAGKGLLRAMFSSYRYTEELIPLRNEAYVLGAFRTQSGGPEAFDEKADLRELLTKWKHDKKMMALLDANKDGQVDMKEWEAARRMGLQKVRQEQVQRAVETPDLHVIARPKDSRPFILSGIPQAALVRRYRIYATLGTAAALAGGGFFLWALNLRGIL